MNRSMSRSLTLLAVLFLGFLPVGGTDAGRAQPADALQSALMDGPEWDITFVSANLDTVIIELKIVGSQWTQSACYASTNPACPLEGMRWVITPCPLKFHGSTSYVEGFCSNGTFDFAPPFANNIPIRVALRAGLTYTFSGSLRTYGVVRSHDGACDNIVCSLLEEPAPKTYVATPVATVPTTWGKVKAKYR